MKKKNFYAIRAIFFGVVLLNSIAVIAGPGGQDSQQQDKKGDNKKGDGKKGDGKKQNKDSEKKGDKKSSDTKNSSSASTATVATGATAAATGAAAGAGAVAATQSGDSQTASSDSQNAATTQVSAQPTQSEQQTPAAQPQQASASTEDQAKKSGKKTAQSQTKKSDSKSGVTQVVQTKEDISVVKNDLGIQPITFQPPLVQVVQGNILSASVNGVDVTDDLKKLVVYYVNIDSKKYPGLSKDFLSGVFEGDPSSKNEMNYVVVFADGTRKDLGQTKEGKSISSPKFTQPFQVLEARFGGISGKDKTPSYIDVTRYLQDNIYATISSSAIKTQQDPAKVQALNTLMQQINKKLVQITLNGATVPANLSQGWPVKTTLRAPGAAPIGSLKPQPKWTAQIWDNKIPAKVLKKPEVTITAIRAKQYRDAEVKNYQKLPSVLQAVQNQNKTAEPNEVQSKKGKKEKNTKENSSAPTGLNTPTSTTVVSTQNSAV